MLLARAIRVLAPIAALLLLADPAHGKLPAPWLCQVPKVLTMVGRDASGVADPIGTFTVVCRDLQNLPIADAAVELDFTQCPDARFCSDQAPSGVADCPNHRVYARATTGPDGVASLRVVGAADHAVPATNSAQLLVLANGVVMAFVRVAALDQDGGGVGPQDLSLWLDDYFASPDAARSDYDGDGAVGPADLSIWLDAYFGGGSIFGGSASSCP